MREYSRVSPRFWVGTTGRQIRKLGADHQVLALYLMTSPQANMIGLYYLPIAYMAHETGIDHKACGRALSDLMSARFCSYDHEAEVVWVCEMARHQIGDAGVTSKQVIGAAAQYDQAPSNAFLGAFFDKYQGILGLKARRDQSSSDSLSIGDVSGIDQLPISGKARQGDEQGKSDEQETCNAPCAALVASDPAVVTIPIRGGEYGVTQAQIDEWQGIYSAIDVAYQLQRIAQHWTANTKGQKTRTGIVKSILYWLDGEQNKAKSPGRAVNGPVDITRNISRNDQVAAQSIAIGRMDPFAELETLAGRRRG
jgi:hypothetical protein